MPTKAELAQVFEENKSQLKSFLVRMTTNVADTEDIIQDAYIKADQNLDSFEGRSTLKTWLFAIAANLARDLLRNQKRWPENVTDICREAALSNRDFLGEMMQIRTTSPQGDFEIKEHISFCFACVSKSLPLEQHLVLLLKEIHGFKVGEIAEITRETEAMVKYYLHQARKKMIAIFDSRCSLINKEGICHQCTELNGIFNPKQDAEEELAKIDMVRKAQDPNKEHLFDLRLQLVEGIDPFESSAAELQLRHLKHNHEVMKKFVEKK